jgi:predicted nucleic acid-binding Zn ribbon protein
MSRSGDGPKRAPAKLGDVVASVLQHAGLSDRVAQAAVIPEWPSLVGVQIAKVTEPVLLQQDGTLCVAVTTHAWMQELTLLEPQLLAALNRDTSRPPVVKLRWMLRR